MFNILYFLSFGKLPGSISKFQKLSEKKICKIETEEESSSDMGCFCAQLMKIK